MGLVPAFFPVQFDETELAVAWGLVGFCEAYLRIFGNPDKSNTSTDSSAVRKNPLIHRIDTVLTSISIEGRPFGFGKAASLIAPQLSEVLVGDIGGVPLKKPNLPPAREDLFRKLYQRWTGLRKEHLQTCAARAQRGERTESAAGVILAAMGEDKAGCVIEAVRARLVNHIVIDTGLKRAIERIIRQD